MLKSAVSMVQRVMDNGLFVCVLGWHGVGVWYGKRNCAIILGLRVIT
jgi:hypothetical protein